jgi:quercetin dioxygenase-like cupin family protein
MPTPIRRVVTGHDRDGKAIVLIDDITPATSTRPGTQASVVWTTQGFPVNNDTSEDTSGNASGTTLKGGTVFRIVEFGPGNHPRNHRTDSIDYAVVMHGEIDMELDDGLVVHVRAGDVLVQRGTIHNWANNGTEPCLIAFMLIDAKPVEKGGRVLSATV